MLFHSRPALLKCDVGTFAPDAILDVLLSIIFGAILDPFFETPLERRFACIWVFSGLGVLVGTCFWPTFGPRFRPYFPALENLIIDSAVPKLLGRYFGHPT
jgi:hypothetical protein